MTPRPALVMASSTPWEAMARVKAASMTIQLLYPMVRETAKIRLARKRAVIKAKAGEWKKPRWPKKWAYGIKPKNSVSKSGDMAKTPDARTRPAGRMTFFAAGSAVKGMARDAPTQKCPKADAKSNPFLFFHIQLRGQRVPNSLSQFFIICHGVRCLRSIQPAADWAIAAPPALPDEKLGSVGHCLFLHSTAHGALRRRAAIHWVAEDNRDWSAPLRRHHWRRAGGHPP